MLNTFQYPACRIGLEPDVHALPQDQHRIRVANVVALPVRQMNPSRHKRLCPQQLHQFFRSHVSPEMSKRPITIIILLARRSLLQLPRCDEEYRDGRAPLFIPAQFSQIRFNNLDLLLDVRHQVLLLLNDLGRSLASEVWILELGERAL